MLLWTAENTATALLLAGMALLACRWLPTRPALCHVLWLLVLVRLIAPPVPVEGWPGVSVSDLAGETVAGPAPAPERPAEAWAPRPEPRGESAEMEPGEASKEEGEAALEQPVAWLGSVDGTGAAPRTVGGTALGALAASVSRSVESLRAPLLWIWGLGALAMLAVQLVRVRRFHRRARAARPAPAALLEVVGEVARRLGVRPPRVAVLSGLGSPVIWSCGRTTRRPG